MKDYNSIRNQQIKGKFVEREVHTCVTGMVEYILRKGYEDREAPFCMEDVTNLYIDNSERINKLEEEREELECQVTEEAAERINKIDEEIDELEIEQEEPQEIYEWWIVSSWLCNKLKEHGEVVLEDENIWGRCTTGQAILLDGVISEICEEMGILEGQEHEWK